MNDTSPEPRPAAAEPAAGEPARASPGGLLRQARERAGIGVEDLAAQIKLAKGTLEALERDDFAVLSEPVYVRGYYRRIAKVLPVAESELLEAYAARVQPKSMPALPRIPLAGGVSAGASRSYRNQGIGLAIAVIVALLAVFLLPGRREPARVTESAPPAEAAPAPAPAPAPAGTDAAASAAGAAAPAPATSQAAPAAPAAPVPAVPNQLVMEFGESSFVRVEDSRNKTLAIGLVRGGERQVLDGQPPYTVFLGNAQHVKVYFGGAPVDFSPHINTQNDTARFTVP